MGSCIVVVVVVVDGGRLWEGGVGVCRRCGGRRGMGRSYRGDGGEIV